MRSSGLFHETALLTAAGICSQILGFFYRIALSRLIGAENMGLFQLIMPLYALLLSATAVGLNSAVSTLTARRLALRDRAGVKTLTDRCIGYFLLLGGGAGCLLALGSDFVSTALLGDARTQLGLILLVPCLLLTGVENLQKHYFYGTGQVAVPALADLAEQLVRIAAVLALLLCFLPQNPERTIGLILCGMVICEVFSACVMTALFRRATRDVRLRREPGLGRLVAGIALPISGTCLLNSLLSSADAVLIPRLLVAGGRPVGQAMEEYGVLFGMTAPLICLPTVLIGSLGMTLTPTLARLTARGQTDLARRTAVQCQRTAALLLLPLLCFLAAVGPEVGEALFQEPSVGRFLLPMAVGVALNAQQSILASVLNGLQRQRTAALHCLLCDGAQLLFTLLTVRTYGLPGYLLGYLAASALAAALHRRAVNAALGAGGAPLSAALAPLPAAVLTGLCAHTLFHCLLDRGLPLPLALAVCALFSAILCAAALAGCGLLPRRGDRSGPGNLFLRASSNQAGRGWKKS